MSTRHERFAGLDVIAKTMQVNQFLWINAMSLFEGVNPATGKGLPEIIVTQEQAGSSLGITKEVQAPRFEFMKAGGMNTLDLTLSITEPIIGFTNRVNQSLLENGLQYFGFSPDDINHDIFSARTVAVAEKCKAEAAYNEAGLRSITARYKKHQAKLGYGKFISDIPQKEMNLNILNDLLDAMSFELNNLNSYTGLSANRSVGEIKNLISSRIKVAMMYLKNLSGDEAGWMGDIVTELEKKLSEAKTQMELVYLSNYINKNVPKLMMVRRAWAL